VQNGDVIFIPSIGKTAGISGEVYKQFIFELKENEILADLLEYSGGTKPTADLSSSQIQRVETQGVKSGFSLIDVDLRKEVSEEIIDGDILHVYPVVNTMQNVVLVSAFAQRPGFFGWNDDLTITDLIESESQLLPGSDRNYVLIKREDPLTRQYSAIQVDLEEIFLGKAEDRKLENRDQIFLFSKKIRREDDRQSSQSRSSTTALKQFNIDQTREIIVIKNSVAEVINKEELRSYQSDGYVQAEFMMKPGDTKIVTNDAEMLVTNGKSVKIINRQDFDYFKSDGYVDAGLDLESDLEKESNELDESVEIANGYRDRILEPFLETLSQQVTKNNPKQTVHLKGNVLFPGEYPLTKDMSVIDAIKAGGGYQDSSFFAEIELNRRALRGKSYEMERSILSARNNNDLKIKIKPGDTILVKQIPNEFKTVKIEGEVYFPGTYPLEPSDTLSELISRAGGLKKDAFINGALFKRDIAKQEQQKRFMKANNQLKKNLLLAQTQVNSNSGAPQNKSTNDLVRLFEVLDNFNVEDDILGRIVIDLNDILSGTSEDIFLEDGDHIAIPKLTQSVSVIGEVYLQTSHLYDQSSSVNDYITLSGGATNYADIGNHFVIKANGAIITNEFSSGFFRGSSQLEPGDTIVIPLKTPPNYSQITDVTQIIYQMALAAAAVNSF
jgi:protein involved in polysaccharide export with SLBB domain